jgi:hypothetical protein
VTAVLVIRPETMQKKPAAGAVDLVALEEEVPPDARLTI